MCIRDRDWRTLQRSCVRSSRNDDGIHLVHGRLSGLFCVPLPATGCMPVITHHTDAVVPPATLFRGVLFWARRHLPTLVVLSRGQTPDNPCHCRTCLVYVDPACPYAALSVGAKSLAFARQRRPRRRSRRRKGVIRTLSPGALATCCGALYNLVACSTEKPRPRL